MKASVVATLIACLTGTGFALPMTSEAQSVDTLGGNNNNDIFNPIGKTVNCALNIAASIFGKHVPGCSDSPQAPPAPPPTINNYRYYFSNDGTTAIVTVSLNGAATGCQLAVPTASLNLSNNAITGSGLAWILQQASSCTASGGRIVPYNTAS